MARALGRSSSAVATIFEATDSSVRMISPARLLRGTQPRDVESVAARLGEQFVEMNRTTLSHVGAAASLIHTGKSVELRLQTSGAIGAVPLASPVSGRQDLGLIVRPRFTWPGVGKVLSESGMRTLPTLLPLGSLPRSDREVPPWVLSSVVLQRVSDLLKAVGRRFEGVYEELPAPRGTVDWQRWATVKLPAARANEVPCRIPDLRVDSTLMGFIHHVIRLQRASLEEQRGTDEIARTLIGLCESLLARVSGWPARPVSSAAVMAWLRRPTTPAPVRLGLEAGLWTVEERGLAGTADLSGLAWRLDMDELFESWIDSNLTSWAPRHGLVTKLGLRRETVTPLQWEPAYLGSQKSLVPDAVLSRPDLTLVVDAKYKSHWDELVAAERWTSLDEAVRDAHRADLLQVLAYTTGITTSRVVGLLIYPCHDATWLRLKERGQWLNRASVAAGERRVDLVLAALPFGVRREDAHRMLDDCISEF